jgi:hypothetical protein
MPAIFDNGNGLLDSVWVGFGLVIRFTGHLQLVTTINGNIALITVTHESSQLATASTSHCPVRVF